MPSSPLTRARITTAAAEFANQHSLSDSLVVLEQIVCSDGPAVTMDVTLASDPDIGGDLILATVTTGLPIKDALDLDERIRFSVVDNIPAADQPYFALRFQFA
jgi:hypothetical protein